MTASTGRRGFALQPRSPDRCAGFGLCSCDQKPADVAELIATYVCRLITEGHLSLADLQQMFLDRDDCTEAQAQHAAENIGEWLEYFDEVRMVPTGPWEIRQGREIG